MCLLKPAAGKHSETLTTFLLTVAAATNYKAAPLTLSLSLSRRVHLVWLLPPHLVEDDADVPGHLRAAVVRRRGPSDERVIKQLGVLGPLRLLLDEARVDKVDELDGEGGGVVEAGRVAVHHLLQLFEHGVPLGVGELAGGELDQSDTWKLNCR